MIHRVSPTQSFWRRYGREILAVALLALAVHDIFGAHGFLAMRRTQKELEQTRANLAKVSQENTDLSGQVQSLKTDPKTIERIAREEMGLARPGEMIFKLPPQGDQAPTDPQK